MTSSVCDNRCQLFHKENVKKEELLRMKWFLKNQQKLIDRLGLKKLPGLVREQEKPSKPSIEETVTVIEQKYLPTWRPPKIDGSINLDVMKPIEPEVRAILYEPGVVSSVATKNYIRKRLEKKPEGRFYYPDCMNWMYGWRLDDFSLPSPSKYGAKNVMLSEFYQRTASSLQRDPNWYRSCQTNNPKNFNELLTY